MQKRRRVVKVIILCIGQSSAKEEGMKGGWDSQQTKATSGANRRNSGADLNHYQRTYPASTTTTTTATFHDVGQSPHTNKDIRPCRYVHLISRNPYLRCRVPESDDLHPHPIYCRLVNVLIITMSYLQQS